MPVLPAQPARALLSHCVLTACSALHGVRVVCIWCVCLLRALRINSREALTHIM